MMAFAIIKSKYDGKFNWQYQFPTSIKTLDSKTVLGIGIRYKNKHTHDYPISYSKI